MIEEIMNGLVKSAIVGGALMAGAGSILYDEYTPPAAAYLQDVQVSPQVAPDNSPDDNAFTHTEISSPTIYSNSIIVDKGAVGPPKQDEYPRGPQDETTSNKTATNFGLVKHD